mmetsp:Transcript_965/g.1510  ORF Transcript_965/g.1510 Transcript_965/m.1510 type:complete len:153 (-) Transcript_965:26-484(-)
MLKQLKRRIKEKKKHAKRLFEKNTNKERQKKTENRREETIQNGIQQQQKKEPDRIALKIYIEKTKNNKKKVEIRKKIVNISFTNFELIKMLEQKPYYGGLLEKNIKIEYFDINERKWVCWSGDGREWQEIKQCHQNQYCIVKLKIKTKESEK